MAILRALFVCFLSFIFIFKLIQVGSRIQEHLENSTYHSKTRNPDCQSWKAAWRNWQRSQQRIKGALDTADNRGKKSGWLEWRLREKRAVKDWGWRGRKDSMIKGLNKSCSDSQISLMCICLDEPMLAAGMSEIEACSLIVSAGDGRLLGEGTACMQNASEHPLGIKCNISLPLPFILPVSLFSWMLIHIFILSKYTDWAPFLPGAVRHQRCQDK